MEDIRLKGELYANSLHSDTKGKSSIWIDKVAGDASFLGNRRPRRVFFAADIHTVLAAGVKIAA